LPRAAGNCGPRRAIVERPMRLPTRFRVRTVMAIVALVALGFGVTFEASNHALRDQALRIPGDRYREASIHFKRAVECQLAIERQEPYLPAERGKELAGDRVRNFWPLGSSPSWGAELQNHLYWGYRSYDEATTSDERLDAIEARLLIHGPGGR
jgi:hypothetical protein